MEQWKKQLLETQNIHLCSEFCIYLSITEEQQNKLTGKPLHWCDKYDKKLKHGPFHPNIIKYQACVRDGGK